ncbi:UDP-N-acetylmuramoyl-L-alanyl-D-glutamate--2,6-diaminopimelate ligase [Marinomonas ostreistagni]|uniref:UDP-N-acetylmuramoyl-L-alanyl-D-glutamate--2, 6-diaminopimelate ligase n=1 Tax=Marinomonas ostreistagni TaxID=359209 RepID=UPI00194F8529|nr:UDP-N-acetylmuramoyl-L-alanyl-D-glutamate--2,6-diaminopimelate ligase [Marinomonas ostreistagni]MBM6549745.1 UDP-N-acetylmuramoyl-L-alanyl-D-glutamate--2,6-diaminopimelate ligase [Marinomonas ostreistagni]
MFTVSMLAQWLAISVDDQACQHTFQTIETDSRLVDNKTLFLALPGVSSDGWEYLDQVAERGANVALVPANKGIVHPTLTLIEVDDIEAAVSVLVKHVYGPPPKHIVAVTGTNGKSSICFYVAQLGQAMGLKSAMIGTFGVGLLGQLQEAKQTTPDLLTLHKQLAAFAHQGVDLVAFEASSHALDQKRLAGVPVTTAIFSNLTRDHLDYHGSMQAYAEAKRKLLRFETLERAIICADSDYAEFMQQGCEAPLWQYSDRDLAVEFAVINKTFVQSGVELDVRVLGQPIHLFLPLLGDFNIQNALAALAAIVHCKGISDDLVVALESLAGAPGRMQPIVMPHAPLILVDYAHTSDALEVALQAVRAHTPGKLICVFGCGGDRDTGKRPLMLEVAQRHADSVWLTSDNPRSEDPDAIIKDALVARTQHSELAIEADRRQAIKLAIAQAQPSDIVLIAGKGHETYQEVNGVRHHFDDTEEARAALQAYVKKA